MSLFEINSEEILGTSIKSQEDFLGNFDNQESDDSWSNSIVIDDDESESNRFSELSNIDLLNDEKVQVLNKLDEDSESDTSETSDSETYEKLGQLIPSPLSKSSYNLARLESFGAKLPNDLSKEKKMSLLIVVLLQMVFINNKDKLTKIYKYLHKKNVLDLEVTKNSYSEMRRNVSFIIESLNNFNPESELGSPDYRLDNKTKYINKYRSNFNQLSLLGKGGYGSVYKVYHLFEKKYYAVKKIFIVQDLISDDYDIFNEIQLYSNIVHENVVRYYSSWVDIDLTSIIEFNKSVDISEDEPINKLCPILFIQMELCDITLREYFLTLMDEDDIISRLQYYTQILKGVEYLHTNGLIHRDLKPDNIFGKRYGSKLIFKIGDFGLTRKNNHGRVKNVNKQEYHELNKLLENLIDNDESNSIITRTNSSNKINKNNLLMIGNEPKLITIHENASNEDEEINQILSLTTEVGTGIYKAKEVDSGYYDKSIDIYALGIILIEFLLNCNTNHEKVSKLSEIFKLIESGEKNIPYLMTNIYDEMIIKMLDSIPNNRPKIEELVTYFSTN